MKNLQTTTTTATASSSSSWMPARHSGRGSYLVKASMLLLIAGGLNWGLVGALRFNLVKWLASHSFAALEPVVYVLVGLAALYHLTRRDFYLPFLGRAVYPCGALEPKVPEKADTQVVVRTQPNANVIYWASEPSTAGVVDDPWLAYQTGANSGVTRADASGMAVLRVRRPASYRVPPFGLTLAPHVHYRTCVHASGMLSPVQTVRLDA